MQRFALGLLLVFGLSLLFSGCGTKRQLPQKSQTAQEYINTYKDLAIKDMRRYKIPASIKLAQAVLESGNGTSTLATKANNHFGIKCNNGWRGAFHRHDDDAPNECFRKYRTVEDSYRDHSEFLSNGRRYAGLFELEITDYKAWAKGLKRAGYATNPQYADLLIGIIERYDLDRYDQMSLRKKKRFARKKENTEKQTYIEENIKPASPLDSSQFSLHEYGPSSRKIYQNNGRKFIFTRKDDSFLKIARDFDIYAYQIYKYNDMDKHSTLHEGQVIYIERKRNRGPKEYHIVADGEDMHAISQRYAVKLDKLYKKNRMEPGSQPHAGEKIYLR